MASFDWLSRCKGLSITTSRKPQILSKNQHKYFAEVLSQNATENRLKTVATALPEWCSCLRLPRGQTCDRQSIFVQEGSFHSTLGRLWCRLFHNPNRIYADSRICYVWYEMLAACALGWQRISQGLNGKHEYATWLYIHVCKIRYSGNWKWKIYHLCSALSFPAFAIQIIFSYG